MVKHIPLRVFIGYDSREPVAYHVLAHSILRHTTVPVSISPVAQHQLTRMYKRPRGKTESTEFSLSRFLVPALSNYEGVSIFMDCDMLCRVDLADVFLQTFSLPERMVYVCPHDYTPRASTKFLGQTQTVYPRKNWSSFMVFNNDRCRVLTEDYVNQATGLELHRLAWAPDQQIGHLPLEWNWLVGEYPENKDAKVLHFTDGGPWFQGLEKQDHADEWRAELSHMQGVKELV